MGRPPAAARLARHPSRTWTAAALRAATRPVARPATQWPGGGGPAPLWIATARLVLRPAMDADAHVLARQWNDPAVGRYLWDGRPVPRGVVARVLRDSHRSFGRHGYGLWAVSRDGLVVGVCGLRPSPHEAGIELLYALDRAAWGRGFAAEAARAVLDRARTRLGVGRVVAAVDAGNVVSWRTLERAGMRRTGRSARGTEDLLLYST